LSPEFAGKSESERDVMLSRFASLLVCAGLVGVLTGCIGWEGTTTVASSKEKTETKSASAPAVDPEVEKALSELSAEDKAAVLAQKYCAVADDSLLGSMGSPIKIELEGKPVFLCCDHCAEEAGKDPKATLAKVEELKKKAAAGG
jgi:hypothetical protein